MSVGYAAVVLYYRAGEVLGATIDALVEQSLPATEILIVDNASEDGVAERIAATRGGVRVLVLAENEGYAGGMNRGVEALRSDTPYVLFLTHEATLAPTAASELVSTASARSASACGPLLSRHKDGSVWSAGGSLSPRGATAHLLSPRSADGEPYEVDWLDGAAMLVDGAALRSIGGFDERYFLYWEDVDVSLRLRRIGPVLCVPKALAAQETGSTPPYYAARNRVVFWKAHGSTARWLGAGLQELEACGRDLGRRRPRVRDALGRALGILDGYRGHLAPARARMRTPDA